MELKVNDVLIDNLFGFKFHFKTSRFGVMEYSVLFVVQPNQQHVKMLYLH